MAHTVARRGSPSHSRATVNGSPAKNVAAGAAHRGWPALTPGERQVVANIRRSGSRTREQLGAQLGWSPSAVSKVVSPLIVGDVLVSDPPGTRRRNAHLSPASDLGFAIGIELGFERVRAAIVDFNGRLVGAKRDYRPDRLSPDAFLACMQKIIRELLVRPLPAPVMGIGIGYADRAAWNSVEAFAG